VVSGPTELAVAGFNYGRFKKKSVADKDSGYEVEFYANIEVPDELKNIQQQIERAESMGIRTMTTLGSISTVIGWDSYRDQWMSEGFAEFSSSLYVQFTRGNDKFVDFWEELRKQIIEASPATKGRKPYTVGPVTQGYRLNNGKMDWYFNQWVYGTQVPAYVSSTRLRLTVC